MVYLRSVCEAVSSLAKDIHLLDDGCLDFQESLSSSVGGVQMAKANGSREVGLE